MQQMARDEQERKMVYTRMSKNIKDQHDYIVKYKIQFKKMTVKEGIQFIDEYTQKKKDEK